MPKPQDETQLPLEAEEQREAKASYQYSENHEGRVAADGCQIKEQDGSLNL